MSNRVAFLLACLCGMAFQAAAQVPNQTLRVGAYPTVPLSYLAPDGSANGFYVDVMREAARREGFRLQMLILREAFEGPLSRGEVDLWAVAVPTPERRKRFYFTESWWAIDHYLAFLSPRVTGPWALAGRLVLFPPAPPFSRNLADVFPGARFQPEGEWQGRFGKLCSGEADAVLFSEDISLLGSDAAALLADCRSRGLRIVPVEQPIMSLSVVSTYTNRPLADAIHGRLRQMTGDGTIAKIASLRMSGNQGLVLSLRAKEEQFQRRILEIILASAALLLAFAAIAYFRLRAANARTLAALDLVSRVSHAKSEFLATLSHELRTPMTAVLGYMDMLLTTPLRRDQREFAEEISHSAAALLQITADVMDFSRTAEGKAALESALFDVTAVLDACLASVALQAEAKSVDLLVRLDDSLPAMLIGDARRLRQIVLNLLVNAVKFTREGSVRLDVSYLEGLLRVEVADTGIGIPKEKQHLVFLAFTQADSSHSRQFGGIGLGLAIVHENCRSMGGSVTLKSEEGAGAIFTAAVPLDAGERPVSWKQAIDAPPSAKALVLAPASPAVSGLLGVLRQLGLAPLQVQSTAEMSREVAAAAESNAEHVYCFIHRACEAQRPRSAAANSQGTREPHLPWTGPFCASSSEEYRPPVETWRMQLARKNGVFVRTGSISDVFEPEGDSSQDCDPYLPLPATCRALREIFHRPSPLSAAIAAVTLASPVLVVDDNAVNRRLLSALLDKLGCQVDLARNGREAVEKVFSRSYAIVLMDCQMPEMNGFEAAATIRSRPGPQSKIPICGLSAADGTEVRVQCMASGMNDYLPKPVTLATLRRLVARWAGVGLEPHSGD